MSVTTASSSIEDQRGVTPDQIDAKIIQEIELATAENSDVWTCPDSNRREYCHSFFQYPAMMVPAVQKKLIDIVSSVAPGTDEYD